MEAESFNALVYDGPTHGRPVAAWRKAAFAIRESQRRNGAPYLTPMSAFLALWLRSAGTSDAPVVDNSGSNS